MYLIVVTGKPARALPELVCLRGLLHGGVDFVELFSGTLLFYRLRPGFLLERCVGSKGLLLGFGVTLFTGERRGPTQSSQARQPLGRSDCFQDSDCEIERTATTRE